MNHDHECHLKIPFWRRGCSSYFSKTSLYYASISLIIIEEFCVKYGNKISLIIFHMARMFSYCVRLSSPYYSFHCIWDRYILCFRFLSMEYMFSLCFLHKFKDYFFEFEWNMICTELFLVFQIVFSMCFSGIFIISSSDSCQFVKMLTYMSLSLLFAFCTNPFLFLWQLPF